MAKNIPLAIVVAGMLTAMALSLGAMALFDNGQSDVDDTNSNVNRILLYEDEFVTIEYSGGAIYYFNAREPATEFFGWSLVGPENGEEAESSDDRWIYVLEDDTSYFLYFYYDEDSYVVYLISNGIVDRL